MQLIDRPSIHSINVAVNHAVKPISDINQKTYTRLSTSLKLNLRRQVFLAVCDDLELRDQLVKKLQTDLAPRFISLNLNLADPNPMAQVSQWLARYAPPGKSGSNDRSFGFQILGVEHLTRQAAPIQKRFLTHLQAIEYYMPHLEGSVLLWLPRPWLRSLQQSAPSFWEWHTALFEFEGDPTPTRAIPSRAVTRLPLSEISSWSGSEILIAQPVETSPVITSPTSNDSITQEEPLNDNADLSDFEPADVDDSDLLQEDDPLPAVIWDILTQDLNQLDKAASEWIDPGSETSQTPEKQAIPPKAPNPLAASKTKSTILPASVSERSPCQANISSKISNRQEEDPPTSQSPLPSLTQVNYKAFLRTCKKLLNQKHSTPTPASQVRQLIQTALNDEPNLEQHQFGVQALQHIEQIQQQGLSQQTLASAYYTLGRGYRECIEQGDHSEHTLKIALCAHEQTIALLPDHSDLKADVANDLGNLYWLQSRYAVDDSGQQAGLEKAIAAYHQALAHTDVRKHPKTGAMIQNNLGSAYTDLSHHHEPAKNLQKAAQAYESALRYRSYQDDPSRYAATQNNLGTTYWNLAQHQQPILYLKQAIAAYQEALRYYTPDIEPLSYAMIQNNIGTAYWNLAQHIQPGKNKEALHGSSPDVLLKCAIVAYQNALLYRTLEVVPAGYAATQNNLGTAYWDLAMLTTTTANERQERLQAAITAYEAAIAAVERLTQQSSDSPVLTFDVSATHNNLGLVCFQLASDTPGHFSPEERQKYLGLALRSHLKALQGWEAVSELRQTTIEFVVQTVRTFFNEFGLQGQAIALSQVPPNLLPEVMSKI